MGRGVGRGVGRDVGRGVAKVVWVGCWPGVGGLTVSLRFGAAQQRTRAHACALTTSMKNAKTIRAKRHPSSVTPLIGPMMPRKARGGSTRSGASEMSFN